ncbi:MAG: sigma-54 interaction domain-containing protein, partial [Vicinamibacteria bacterium]
VLIGGESGTGKELIARLLHQKSSRSTRPFVAVNAAAIPDTLLEAELFGHSRGAFTGAQAPRKGLLEEADSGTLFLDEVADLSPRAQSVLLRALQEREYRRVGETSSRRSDFRLVTASHKDLEVEVGAGRFRHDLRFRLEVARIDLPPLRERSSDILPLARHYLSDRARRLGVSPPRLSPEAERALLSHDWPGNVRELENEITHALVRARGAGEIGPEHFSFARRMRSRGCLRGISAAFERGVLKEALATHGGNRTHAARALGISRQGLYRKLKRHGIGAPPLTPKFGSLITGNR